MNKWEEQPDWEHSVFLVETSTPLIGGIPVWDGNRPEAGFANIGTAQLANRTAFLKNEIDLAHYRMDDLAEQVGSSMQGENNLSELTDVGQAKYRLGLNLVDNTRDQLKPVSEAQQEALDLKVDKDGSKVLTDVNFTTALKSKLDGVATGATKNATDAQLRNRSSHTGTQAISTVSGLQTALDGKQGNLVAGSNISISGNTISSTNTTYTKMSQAEATAGTATTSRTIDAKVLAQTIDNAVSGEVSANALVKSENLNDLPNKATARSNLGLGNVSNTSDANKPISTATQSALNAKLGASANAVSATKLNTSRTLRVDLASTTARGFDGTANVTDIGTSGTLPVSRGGTGGTTQAAARTGLGLGAAATRGVGTSSSSVARGDHLHSEYWDLVTSTGYAPDGDMNDFDFGVNGLVRSSNQNYPAGIPTYVDVVTKVQYEDNDRLQIAYPFRNNLNYLMRTRQGGGVWTEWFEMIHTANTLTSTGNDNKFPMSQKAVTDALASKQGTLTAGSNIAISGSTISATNTTYSAMSAVEMRTGAATTSRTMTAKNINDYGVFVALSGTSVTINFNNGRNFSLSASGNTTFANPSNMKSGITGDIVITSTANRTLSFGGKWKFINGDVPEMKANTSTVISYKVVDANTIVCGFAEEVK